MKNNKGFAHILVLIFVVAGIGVLGYLLLNGRFLKVTPHLTNTPATFDNNERMVVGKKYENSKYGYSLDLPANWEALEHPSSTTDNILSWVLVNPENHSPIEPMVSPLSQSSFIEPGLSVIVYDKPFEDESLARSNYNCNPEHEGCILLFKYEKMTFNSLPALKAVAQFPNDPVIKEVFGNITPYTYIQFNYQNHGFVIGFEHKDFQGNYNHEYDQILSTFKFTK